MGIIIRLLRLEENFSRDFQHFLLINHFINLDFPCQELLSRIPTNYPLNYLHQLKYPLEFELMFQQHFQAVFLFFSFHQLAINCSALSVKVSDISFLTRSTAMLTSSLWLAASSL